MITAKHLMIMPIISLFMLLFSSGCADITVNPDVNTKGSGVIVDYKYKATKSFTYTVDLTTQSRLTVEGINGEINVESVSDINYVMISGQKTVSSDTYEDAESHLGDISIGINTTADELFAKTLHPKFSDGRSYKVDLIISMPDHLNNFIKNVNGKISGNLSIPFKGTIVMNLVNGNIELEIPQTTSANFYASLENGGISIENLVLLDKIVTGKSLSGIFGDGEGSIDLRTVNGDINVSGY